MPNSIGKRVLEVGTGTGTIAVFCYLKGAIEVQAIDINLNAVRNAMANFKRHAVQGRAYGSDLFDEVNGTRRNESWFYTKV